MIVITVILSVAFIPFDRASLPTSTVPSSNLAGVAYYDNSTGVNVLAYSFNQFGQPISGTQVNVTAVSGNIVRSAVSSTNSSGFARLVISIPYPSSTLNDSLVATSGQGYFTAQIPLPSGEIESIFQNIAPVVDSSDPNKVDVGMFYASAGGKLPTGDSAYFQVIGYTNVQYCCNESSMTLMGPLTSYYTVLSFPAGTNITAANLVSIAVFDSAGNQVNGYGAPGSTFESLNQLQKEQSSAVQGLASSFVGGLLGLFVPLMAVLASYSTYGKDRVSGVLESVLARPVSRRGLSISRYASTSLALVLAVVLTFVALDGVVAYITGLQLSWWFLGTGMAALSVEALAFVGIMFAFSRVIKSTGSLVGLGVGLWAILELFWSLIIFLIISLLRIDFGSVVYYRLSVGSSFFNPAQFYNLVSSLTSSSFQGFQFNPADYGVSVYSLAATGVLWVAIPFAVFIYLAVKRD